MRIKTALLFERTFEDLLSCGHKYYSKNTIKNLYARYKECRLMLLDNPNFGQLEPLIEGFQLEYRRIFIQPYFKIIYTINNDEIILVDLWDVRQSPINLYERIENV